MVLCLLLTPCIDLSTPGVVFQRGEEGRSVHGRCSGGQPRQSTGEPAC